MTSAEEIEAALEAILFVSPDPIPRRKLIELFGDGTAETVDLALHAIAERYRSSDSDDARGVILDEVAGGLRLVTRPDLVGYLRKFYEVTGRTKLSMAALETLAIVAYRQPVTGPEIHELRGKNSAGVLKTLLERRLIRISGRREVVGKPFEYSTSRDFLMHFGLSSLADLPPLEEFEETFLSDGDYSGIGDQGMIEDREEQIELEDIAAEELDEERYQSQQAEEEYEGALTPALESSSLAGDES